jgi:hypothetical protein
VLFELPLSKKKKTPRITQKKKTKKEKINEQLRHKMHLKLLRLIGGSTLQITVLPNPKLIREEAALD